HPLHATVQPVAPLTKSFYGECGFPEILMPHRIGVYLRETPPSPPTPIYVPPRALQVIHFNPCTFNLLVKFVSSRIEAVKLQIVLQMVPQMQPMTKTYHGPLDRPASPCSNVNDIEDTPPEKISTAQSLLCPNSAGSS
ncbi:syncytin-1-like, partial [Symphalangus syndactylus]|uniref:syncytin-1-like n=1 Tax=Symphalangus syndactylus TaxID=9590 RepID=UPI0030060CF5